MPPLVGSAGDTSPLPRELPRATVFLWANGVVEFEVVGARGRRRPKMASTPRQQVSLDGLGLLAAPAEGRYEFFRKLHAAGAPERLPVCLRLDKDAPWMHVSWLFSVLSEARLRATWCEVRSVPDDRDSAEDRAVVERLEAGPLPTGTASPRLLGFEFAKPPTIDFAREVEVEIERAPPSAREGAAITVHVDGRALADLRDLAGTVVEALGEGDRPSAARIHLSAGPDVAWKHVLAVLCRLLGAAGDRVDLADVGLPRREVREAPVLPPPGRGERRTSSDEGMIPPPPERD